VQAASVLKARLNLLMKGLENGCLKRVKIKSVADLRASNYLGRNPVTDIIIVAMYSANPF
jgi:hypothetical protein